MSATPSSPSQPFAGFPSGKVPLVRIPAPFFTKLLPAIDSIEELKVTLYALWLLDRMEGDVRYLLKEDFLSEKEISLGLAPEPDKTLEIGLQQALARGSMLSAEVAGETGTVTCYFLNTPRGRAAVEAIHSGNWKPSGNIHHPVQIGQIRPNIFKLYEENIGPLTPLIAETLQEAEKTYPQEWIEEAVQIAVENNVRRWRYIQVILESWQKEGHNEQNRGDTEKDRRRYIEGPFAEFIHH